VLTGLENEMKTQRKRKKQNISKEVVQDFAQANLDREQIRLAQQVIDDVRDDPLHPANNPKHPQHQQALEALEKLEQEVFLMAVELDNRIRKNGK
jgi:hypothetical protein